MHWIEGVPLIVAGTIAWMIGRGTFPGNPEMLERMRIAAPWTRNRTLMGAMAAFLWAFGLAVLTGFLM